MPDRFSPREEWGFLGGLGIDEDTGPVTMMAGSKYVQVTVEAVNVPDRRCLICYESGHMAWIDRLAIVDPAWEGDAE
jgi:hypothetical protein